MKCYVSQQKGFKKYILKSEIRTDVTHWKVITARAAHAHKIGFGNIFVGKPGTVHSKSYISFDTNTMEEAESLCSYMRCRMPNFVLSLRKNSQDISASTCTWIPLPPLDRQWTDSGVYDHFNLTDAEIQLITETHIVGFKAVKHLQ